MKRQLWFAAKSIVVLACLLLLWHFVVIALKIPKYILPGPWPVAKAVKDRFPDLANSLLLTTEAAAMGLTGSVIVGVAVALVFAQWRALRQLLFPYTILLADCPDRGHCAAHHHVGWIGNLFGGTDRVYHLPCADHRQYHAGTDQRGRKFAASFSYA
jgi:hypothetical protein